MKLVSLLWTDGDRHIPCDYRIYHKPDGLTKNDHFQAMMRTAHTRSFQPRCVLFDGWYSSLDNLKLLRGFGWNRLTRLKCNRLVNLNRQGTRALRDTDIAAKGTEIWLPGYGLVKVFKIVAPDGDIAYWASSDLALSELTRRQYAEASWTIENYHRGIKQCTEVEKCQTRSARSQRNHIGLALRAFFAGNPLLHPRHQLAGSQDRDHPRRGTALFGSSKHPTAINCVTPIYVYFRQRVRTSARNAA